MKHTFASPIEIRERYLALLYSQLIRKVDAIEAFESVSEIRDHLDLMAASYEELGCDQLHAMKLTIERFGPPIQVVPIVRTLSRPIIVPSIAPAWITTAYCVAASYASTMLGSVVLLWITPPEIAAPVQVLLLRTVSPSFVVSGWFGCAVGIVIAGIVLKWRERPIFLSLALSIFVGLVGRILLSLQSESTVVDLYAVLIAAAFVGLVGYTGSFLFQLLMTRQVRVDQHWLTKLLRPHPTRTSPEDWLFTIRE